MNACAASIVRRGPIITGSHFRFIRAARWRLNQSQFISPSSRGDYGDSRDYHAWREYRKPISSSFDSIRAIESLRIVSSRIRFCFSRATLRWKWKFALKIQGWIGIREIKLVSREESVVNYSSPSIGPFRGRVFNNNNENNWPNRCERTRALCFRLRRECNWLITRSRSEELINRNSENDRCSRLCPPRRRYPALCYALSSAAAVKSIFILLPGIMVYFANTGR